MDLASDAQIPIFVKHLYHTIPNPRLVFFLTLAGKKHLANFLNNISHTSHACFPNPKYLTHQYPTERDIPETKEKEAILYCQKMSYKGTPNTHQKDAKKQ